MSHCTPSGTVSEMDAYRPPTRGRHPGVLLCLGVLPRGWSALRVAREMAKGYTAWYPLFRATTA